MGGTLYPVDKMLWWYSRARNSDSGRLGSSMLVVNSLKGKQVLGHTKEGVL